MHQQEPSPSQKGGHRRRRRRRGRTRARVAAVVFGSLTALTAMVVTTWSLSNSTAPRTETGSSQHASVTHADTIETAATAPHPVYRYSVIPGGAHNRQELVTAISRDRVVADHYRTVSLDRVREERLTEERRAYVSYRVGDRVFWTGHRVTLPAGERILTDGAIQIRARCGNCISYEPQLPTSSEEPDEVEFEALSPAAPDIPSARLAAPKSVTPVVILGRGPTSPDLTALLVPTSIGQSTGWPSAAAQPGLASRAGQGVRRPAVVDSFPAPSGDDPDGSPGDPMPGGSAHTNLLPETDFPHTVPPVPGSLIARMPSIGTEFIGSEGTAINHDTDSFRDAPVQPVPVPEPSTIVLFGTGAAGVLWRRLRSRRTR
jgi:hypothetical protein